MELLDAGATIAQIIGPEENITCTDLAPHVFPQADTFAQSIGVTSILFKTADVHRLPFKDASFDVVHCNSSSERSKISNFYSFISHMVEA